MAQVAQFSRNIRKRGRQVVNSASRAVRSSAKGALRGVIDATPVDTGEARSNWRVGVGAAPTAVIEPYSRYPKGSKANGAGRGERANAGAAYSVGASRIDSVRGVSGVGLKTAIFIVNNTRQIGFLNAGSSSQAPGGFIQAAFSGARESLRGFRLFDR